MYTWAVVPLHTSLTTEDLQRQYVRVWLVLSLSLTFTFSRYKQEQRWLVVQCVLFASCRQTSDPECTRAPQPHMMTTSHSSTFSPPSPPTQPEDLKGEEEEEEEWDPEHEYTEEPHASRRREILRKHPEIKRLMGYDPFIAVIVTAEVLAQIFFSWLLQDSSWPCILLLGYFLSPFFNQSLGVAMHEMGHNLAFGHRRAWMNRLLGIWCNLPLAVPMAITFKKYHALHHRYLGDDIDDVDVPCKLETYFFHHPLTKFLWMVFHPLFYAVRPFYKCPRPLSAWELVNVVSQLTFDYVIYVNFGVKSLMYLLLGLAFGLSFHPLAAHYISEHYFLKGGEPTHSYYGPLNWILFNAGFHNEHHDFPYIPYSRLPEVKRLAPEFYDNLPHHSSWVKVLWDFVFDVQTAPHAKGEGVEEEGACQHGLLYRKVL
ncbi:sphingolipid delta(4)-desaturase DES1-like isoform X1 [Babylonia areolata]|uniref:sphingolipid delta(4)-desaturase DES1-like isoform X1 n=2 Tax=Babylonia areolata TaxID=304850 RepID=UPI003FD349D8